MCYAHDRGTFDVYDDSVKEPRGVENLKKGSGVAITP